MGTRDWGRGALLHVIIQKLRLSDTRPPLTYIWFPTLTGGISIQDAGGRAGRWGGSRCLRARPRSVHVALSIFHLPELSYMTHHCKRGWEIQPNLLWPGKRGKTTTTNSLLQTVWRTHFRKVICQHWCIGGASDTSLFHLPSVTTEWAPLQHLPKQSGDLAVTCICPVTWFSTILPFWRNRHPESWPHFLCQTPLRVVSYLHGSPRCIYFGFSCFWLYKKDLVYVPFDLPFSCAS